MFWNRSILLLVDPKMRQHRTAGATLLCFACTTCGSPAVVLPKELNDSAGVRCQGCDASIATWGLFKAAATQAILSESKDQAMRTRSLGPDPLDTDLLRAHGVMFWANLP